MGSDAFIRVSAKIGVFTAAIALSFLRVGSVCLSCCSTDSVLRLILSESDYCNLFPLLSSLFVLKKEIPASLFLMFCLG